MREIAIIVAAAVLGGFGAWAVSLVLGADDTTAYVVIGALVGGLLVGVPTARRSRSGD